MQVQRTVQIEEVLNDLKQLKVSGTFSNGYALDENIAFFQSTLKFSLYFHWLLNRAPKIDGAKLLELADLPIERWDLLLHKELIAVERRRIPGMLRPLVKEITKRILNYRDTLIMDFGSGGMETERQVINSLIKKGFNNKVIFVGVDRSAAAHNIAQQNLAELNQYIDFQFISNIDYNKIKEIEGVSKKHFIVITCQNDIFALESGIPQGAVDIVFHTRFRHHLTAQEACNLDLVTSKITKFSVEFDEYKSYPLMLMQTLFAWRSPVLLNGAIFSRLREQSKKTIKASTGKISFQPSIGTYMKIVKHVG